MTLPQFLSVAVLVGMMAMFLWGRFRYDVVAVMALLAAVVAGIVKPADAFRGFSDDIVIIVGSALVLSGAVQRSGAIERLMRRLQKHVTTVRSQLLLLAASVGLGSALVKNIGALAMMMPAAFQMAKKSDTSPSAFLMPMAFASLLGGLITLIGTSPNIIVSRVREEMTGQPFHMFDYAPVGLGLTVVGLIFLRFGYRLLPLDRRAAPTMGEALDIHDYATEAKIVEQSAAVGERVEDFIARHEQEVSVIEAVVSAGSPLVGGTAGSLMLRQRFGINLIAVSRQGERIVRRMPNVIFRAGDVIVLQGPLGGLPQTLNELGALPLAERELRLGSVRKGLLPIAILAVAMAATATGVVPVTIAFFAAAAAVVITGALPVRDAYEHVEWPILIMLGALIPVSDTLRATGVTEIIGNWLSLTAASLPPWGAVALIMAAAMAVTPFLNNAATVLVMAPIAATFAGDLGLRPEAFLMATAVGAGCDFLTPIGHQCNTLVMGPGGYRFSDYARLGAPLSLLVLVVGTPLILWVWPVA